MISESDAVDPDELARRCAEAMYDADAASRGVGMQVTHVAAGRATVRMTITGQMLNGHGIGHGGYTFMLADTAFAIACNTYDVATVAAACDIVFLAPTKEGDLLEATATQRHRGSRRGVYDISVARLSAQTGADRSAGGGVEREVVAEFRGISQATRDPILGRTPSQ